MDDLLGLLVVEIGCNSEHSVAGDLLLLLPIEAIVGGHSGHEVVVLGLLVITKHEVGRLVRLTPEVRLLLLLLLHLLHVLTVSSVLRSAV